VEEVCGPGGEQAVKGTAAGGGAFGDSKHWPL
jgi:hypothetical protein